MLRLGLGSAWEGNKRDEVLKRQRGLIIYSPYFNAFHLSRQSTFGLRINAYTAP